MNERDGRPCEWTREEERALVDLVDDMGTYWNAVSAVMGRTPGACQSRYYRCRGRHPRKASYHDVGNFYADIPPAVDMRDRCGRPPPRPATHLPGEANT